MTCSHRQLHRYLQFEKWHKVNSNLDFEMGEKELHTIYFYCFFADIKQKPKNYGCMKNAKGRKTSSSTADDDQFKVFQKG